MIRIIKLFINLLNDSDMGPMAIPMMLSGLKAGTGLIQTLTARRPERPYYNIPMEVFEAMEIAKQRMMNPLPSKEAAEGKMLDSVQAAMDVVKEVSTGPMASDQITKLVSNMVRGTRDLDIVEDEARTGAERTYMGQLGNVARYRDQAFDYNENLPFQQMLNEYYNQKSAGMENFIGGVSDMGSNIFSVITQDKLNQVLSNIHGVDYDPMLPAFGKKKKAPEEQSTGSSENQWEPENKEWFDKL